MPGDIRSPGGYWTGVWIAERCVVVRADAGAVGGGVPGRSGGMGDDG